MGRTNPTYRDYLQRFEDRCQPLRRGLRHEYKHDFDRLFDRAQTHADAAGYLNSTDPELAILLSILLAQEHDIRQLQAQMEDEP
jgi:uncharacterized membrane protein YccC